jgi:hypothetical protein
MRFISTLSKGYKLVSYLALTGLLWLLMACGAGSSNEQAGNTTTPAQPQVTTATVSSVAVTAPATGAGFASPTAYATTTFANSPFPKLVPSASSNLTTNLLIQAGDDKYYRYKLGENKVDSLPDYNDDPSKPYRPDILRRGYISPDRQKAAVLADTGRAAILWITDLSKDPPKTLVSFDFGTLRTAKFDPHWNSSSDGLVFRSGSGKIDDAGSISIFSLANSQLETVSPDPGCYWVMSWSTTKNEIYCLLIDQNKLGIISTLTKTSKIVQTPVQEKATLSSNGQYLSTKNSFHNCCLDNRASSKRHIAR